MSYYYVIFTINNMEHLKKLKEELITNGNISEYHESSFIARIIGKVGEVEGLLKTYESIYKHEKDIEE